MVFSRVNFLVVSHECMYFSPSIKVVAKSPAILSYSTTMPLLGCIADDVTGATDLALTLVHGGMRTEQIIGVPDTSTPVPDCDAIVVALKSRTCPGQDAINDSLAAARWLKANGAQQLFFKYCSTFDSTDEGNIGPVADALMDFTGATIAIACPAFPTNGRTIKNGDLYVGDVLLSESGMRNHPLTPMTDSNLVRVLGRQTHHGVGLVNWETVRKGPKDIEHALEGLVESNHRYAIVDAIDDHDLEHIGTACADHPLITGGSGVALGLPENFKRQGSLKSVPLPKPPTIKGRSAILAGSCSEMTLSQLAHTQNKTDWPHRRIDSKCVEDPDGTIKDILDWAARQPSDKPVVIYSSAAPDEIAALHEKIGREHSGELMERIISGIAAGLAPQGVTQFVLAGGETSGAVLQALKVKSLRIGPEIDPGVPWTEAVTEAMTEAQLEPTLALTLKSGNFGAEDFFVKALKMLG
jgi:3-dehydrotetronate 4-kinase